MSGAAIQPAEGPAGLDPARLQDWITGLGVGAQPPLGYKRFGSGKSNLTYLVTDSATKCWVLRRPPLGQLLASAHDVTREARILDALGTTRVPAPRVFGLAAAGEICEAPVLLMEHVEGLLIDDSSDAAILSLEQRVAVSNALASTLALIHDVDLKAAGLLSLSSHEPYADRQLKRWHRQWERSRNRKVPIVDELAERLRSAVPKQRELTILHGDFHLRNVILSPSDGNVRTVLDWELCTLGDPLADVGSLLAYWPQSGEQATAINDASKLPGFLSRDELAAVYGRASERTLEHLGFWYVFGLWKLAIIAEGVRHRDSDTARPHDRITEAGVDELIARAVTAAESEHLL